MKILKIKVRQLDDGRFYVRYWWRWYEISHRQYFKDAEALATFLTGLVKKTKWKRQSMNPMEVLALYNKPTGYEQENRIEIIKGWQFFRDAGDVKFYTRKKSDGSITLLIIFRAGTTDHWCGWMPNEGQFKTLHNLMPSIISTIEKANETVKA